MCTCLSVARRTTLREVVPSDKSLAVWSASRIHSNKCANGQSPSSPILTARKRSARCFPMQCRPMPKLHVVLLCVLVCILEGGGPWCCALLCLSLCMLK